MRSTIRCDSKGRLQLWQALRKRYGTRFAIVAAPGRLILIPVPDDPVKDLAELGKPLRGLSIRQIKARIRARAVQEALRGIRRH